MVSDKIGFDLNEVNKSISLFDFLLKNIIPLDGSSRVWGLPLKVPFTG